MKQINSNIATDIVTKVLHFYGTALYRFQGD